MRILALDPATAFGWCLADTSFIAPTWGVWDLSTRRDESAGMKLLRLESKLVVIAQSGIDLVVYEAARNSAPRMQGALVHQAKLQAIVERFCTRHTINYRGYSPSEIKKFATGKGNANKSAVVAAARKRFGYEGENDNEADALCLMHLALQEYGQ